jgi:Tfp pilus assembly protein FimT
MLKNPPKDDKKRIRIKDKDKNKDKDQDKKIKIKRTTRAMTRTRIKDGKNKMINPRSGETETKTGWISKQRLENLLDAVNNEERFKIK